MAEATQTTSTPAAGGAPPPAGTTTSTPATTTTPGSGAQASQQGAPNAGAAATTPEGAGAGKDTGTPATEAELTLPKGFEVNPELLGSFKDWAKASGLKGEQAQKALDLFAKSQEATGAKLKADWEAQQKTWEESLKSDKEFGGAKYDENVETARQAVERFGSPELRQYLDKTGLGSHPALVRTFHKIGLAFKDDTVRGGAGRTSSASAEVTPKDLFPSMFKE